MKRIYRYLLSMILIASGLQMAMSQNISTPYSMYGYGILGDYATSMQRQMGGVGYALRSGRQINVMNPASYAAIDSLTFLFDIGADLSLIWRKDGAAKEHSTGGGLDYITMQFPISKYFGGSVGMLPVSGVGYAFGNEIISGTSENQGSGGINMAYLGFAGKYKGASLGFNISYNFGNIVNDIYGYPVTGGQTLTEHVMQVRDWDINIGAQYGIALTKNDRLTLGVTYAPKKTLLGKTWVTTQETSRESTPDTIAYSNLKKNFYMPNRVGAGISFTHERASRLTVELDFSYQQWSKASYPALYTLPDPERPSQPSAVAFEAMKFNDRYRYAAGAEFVPKLRGSYMQRVAYRLGAYYCDDYLNIGGNKVREIGVTCGLGFHTPQDKTIINLGFEWKQRQAHPIALVKENYFNITLGINFNELWFYQRKIR